MDFGIKKIKFVLSGQIVFLHFSLTPPWANHPSGNKLNLKGSRKHLFRFGIRLGDPLGFQLEPVDASSWHPILEFQRRFRKPFQEEGLDSICFNVDHFVAPVTFHSFTEDYEAG